MKLASEECWAIAHAACIHTTADYVQAYWSLDFNCTPLHIHTRLTIWILNSDFQTFQLAPELPEYNYYVSCKRPEYTT
jgi:hypothetical protein